MHTWKSSPLAIFFLLLGGCGESSQKAEFYGDLLTSEGGLTLTESEHRIGWGKKQCFMCHIPDNIHQVDNIADLDINLKDIQDIVRKEGVESCRKCHGTNGVKK